MAVTENYNREKFLQQVSLGRRKNFKGCLFYSD